MTAVEHDAATAGWRTDLDDAPIAIAVAGSRIAVAGAAGEAVLLDAGTGATVATAVVDGGLLDVAASPDGRHLALTGPAGYALWDTGTGQLRRFDTGAWSAHARWAGADRVAVSVGRRAAVHDCIGEHLWATGECRSTITDLAWQSDGRYLAVTAYGGVYRYARYSGDAVGSYAYPGSHLALAVAPTGRWMCTGNQDRSVHIWRTRDGGELEMPGYSEKVSRLAFDPTGAWLANDGAPDITVWDFTGKGPRGRSPRLLRSHDTITALAWRPGGGALLTSGGSEGAVCGWNVNRGVPGRPTRPIWRHDLGAPVTALAWLDRDTLVAATRHGQVLRIATGPARSD
jgi:WD40 repeat protein